VDKRTNVKQTGNEDKVGEVYEEEEEPVVPEKVTLGFNFVDNPPVYPGCEGLPKDRLKQCTSQKIQEFLTANFNKSVLDSLKLPKGTRISINTRFQIDENGKVTNVLARSKYRELEKETKRVLRMLPQMKPAVHKGKKVKVKYNLPIWFKVE
jgi:protein TonB